MRNLLSNRHRLAHVALSLTMLLVLACGEEKAAEEVGIDAPLADEELETITQGLTMEKFEKQANTDGEEFDGLVKGGAKMLVSPLAAKKLASDEAAFDLPNHLSGDSEPVFLKLLDDLGGKPSAWVAVYPVKDGTAEQMLTNLKEGFIKREQGIKEKKPALIEEGNLQMMQLDSFHTVVMGATPFSRKFIQSHAGIPRYLAMGLEAHKRAFRQLKVPPKEVKLLGGRYDNRAGPGDGFTILLEVPPKDDADADGPKPRFAFRLHPDDYFGGDLEPLEKVVEAKAEFYKDHPLTPEVKSKWAQKWNSAVKVKGLDSEDEPWCIACTEAEPHFKDPEGPGPMADFAEAIAAAPYDSIFDSGDDGTETEPCSNCSDFVAECYLSVALPGLMDPPAEEDCTGYTWSFASTGFISGVPNLKQWKDDFYTAFFDDGYANVGCGPVAATTVLAWYDSLGFDNLVTNAGYSTHDSATYTGWQGVAVRLNVLMDTTEAGTAAYTLSGNFEDGFEEYIDERGYTGGISEVDEDEDIVGEIVDGRPLILLYASGGWARDHYAAIVGYYNDAADDDFYIHVNVGWGGYSVTFENGDTTVAGVVRYHWDHLYEGVQDAKIWRVRIYSGDTEWDEDAVDCMPLDPCSDLGLSSCTNYATMPPNRTSDPKAIRPPNLPDATCTPERDLFDATECVVKFWGSCISESGITFTCDPGDAHYGYDYVESCF